MRFDMIRCITIFCWRTNCLKSEGESCNSFSLLFSPSFDVGLLLTRSHGARRGAVHLMHNSANAELGQGERPLTVGLGAPPSRRLLHFLLLAEVHCYSGCALCGSSRSLRQSGRVTRHFFVSVTSAAWWKVSLSGPVIGSNHIALASLSIQAAGQREAIWYNETIQYFQVFGFYRLVWGWMEPHVAPSEWNETRDEVRVESPKLLHSMLLCCCFHTEHRAWNSTLKAS